MDLIKRVRSIRNLEKAWRVIEENGRHSKSIEVQREIASFQEDPTGRIKSISGRLVRKTFEFVPARGVPIPKATSGKARTKAFRPIVLAPLESRIVQRSILDALLTVPALKAFAENEFSFGGIRKSERQALSAVPAAIEALLKTISMGASHVICADITAFFTRISKSSVSRIIENAVNNPEFMTLFHRAIHVELSNMASLREKAQRFPIADIGVAQGNSLSPLLGNIILHDFDKMMNEGDCRCLRYIDDFIILAPSAKAARAKLRQATKILNDLGMSLSAEKTSVAPISIVDRFEFLGIEFSNGLIRPDFSSRKRLAEKIDKLVTDSHRQMEDFRQGKIPELGYSLLDTLNKIEGTINGWGKHYWFCNDLTCFGNADDDLTKVIRQYLASYRDLAKNASAEMRRKLLGVTSLRTVKRRPFEWPKRVANSKLQADEDAPEQNSQLLRKKLGAQSAPVED